jgi:hypothetical protein
MILPEAPRYLLDVNVLVALLDEDHIRHWRATACFLLASTNNNYCAPDFCSSSGQVLYDGQLG